MSDDDSGGGVTGFLRDNWLWFVAMGLAYLAATDLGLIEPVEMPAGSGLVVMAAVIVAIAGWIVAGKIEGLLPDDHGIYIPVINAYGEPFQLWELTEDQWEDLDVVDGPLKHIPDAKYRAYEAFAYNPEKNVAVSTWRKTLEGSDVVGQPTADAALDLVKEMRDDLEDEARYGRVLRRQLPSVIRRLDRRRAMEQNKALEPNLTPSFADGDSLDDLIGQELPNQVLPDRLSQDEAVGHSDGSEDVGDEFEVDVAVDGADALEPLADGSGGGE